MYGKRELASMPESRLAQFFTRTDGSYQVKKIVRDMCVFAVHNFLKDPPFAKIDFISCRNVLIYMEPFLQKKAFTTFHYALNEKGYLLLGKSETTGISSDLFLPLDKKEKLYTRKFQPGRFMNIASERREEALIDKDYGLRSKERKRDDFQKNAEDILLSKYTPAGVIVNEQFDIVQFRGSTGEFLEPAAGKASLSVLKMAREGLSFELRNALHKSKSTNEVVRKEEIPIDNGKKLVTVEVIPLLDTIDLHFLILFKEAEPIKIQRPTDGNQQAPVSHINDEKDIRIEQLAKDLLQAREDMRSITEDQEAANEELQSANEELLSGSEELQSLNEELETSKEELQSTNEELITVNQELYDRNDQLNIARFYAEAIVTTIHEPLLVLSEDFKIKSANQSFYKTFSIREEEAIGHILFGLQGNGWNIPGLSSQLLRIQKGDEKFLEWELTYNFPKVGQRTICFNAQPVQKENAANWILLAFNDISERKDREKIGKKNAEDLKNILENMPLITFTASPAGLVTYFNEFFLNYSGITITEALGSGWTKNEVIKPDMFDDVVKRWKHAMETGEGFNAEVRLKRKSDNMYRWHLGRAAAIRNEEGVITSWVGAAIDIHDQKTKEEAKDEFISIASHELRTPLTTAKAYIYLLQDSMKKSNYKDLIFAQKAGTSIDRLNDLVGELLDVSKIQNGMLHLSISEFNFNDMVADAIEGAQYTSPDHTITCTGHINKPVTGDKERLQQVVINLLTNAVKYSPNDDKVLVNLAEENGSVKVSVKDGGIGILKENLDKIFERYYREEERSVRFQGLGIGLSICYEIIQRHKGKIWAESNHDKGTTFYFTIPI
jgi:two-component system CheB/CheR fusion protein